MWEHWLPLDCKPVVSLGQTPCLLQKGWCAGQDLSWGPSQLSLAVHLPGPLMSSYQEG